MSKRASPNPKCAYCGVTTETSKAFGRTTYETKCTSITCSILHGEGRIEGKGLSVGQARDDYRAKAAEIKGGAV